MGDMAYMMLNGYLCGMCGICLPCTEKEKDNCAEMEIPMFCSIKCAKDFGTGKEQVCWHKPIKNLH